MRNWTKSSERRNNFTPFWVGSVLLLLVVVFLSLRFGSSSLSFGTLWDLIWQGDTSTPAGRIFWFVRVPRTLATVCAGAALAVSGAILQAVLANPLASPNILGVNAGAALGVTLVCTVSLDGKLVSIGAFAGALVAVGVVYGIARATGASRLTLVLSGIAVQALLSAVGETIRTLFPEIALNSLDFRIGGFSAVVTERLWPACVLIVGALLLSLLLTKEIDLLSMGEQMAHGLGVQVGRTRLVLLILSTVLAGAAVSFAGLLGFVGLIVPHAVRRLCGSASIRLLPLSAVGGACLVTLCDWIGRICFAPYEIPAGVLLAFVGAPFFLYILILRRNGGGMHRA